MAHGTGPPLQASHRRGAGHGWRVRALRALDGVPCQGGGGGTSLGAMQNKHSCPLGCVAGGLAGHSAQPAPAPLLPAPAGVARLLGLLPTCSLAAPEPPRGNHGRRARVTTGPLCRPWLSPSGRGAASSARLPPEPFGQCWLQMPALHPGVLPMPAPTLHSESSGILVPSLLPSLLWADQQSRPGWSRRGLSITSVPSRTWACVLSRHLGEAWEVLGPHQGFFSPDKSATPTIAWQGPGLGV